MSSKQVRRALSREERLHAIELAKSMSTRKVGMLLGVCAAQIQNVLKRKTASNPSGAQIWFGKGRRNCVTEDEEAVSAIHPDPAASTSKTSDRSTVQVLMDAMDTSTDLSEVHYSDTVSHQEVVATNSVSADSTSQTLHSLPSNEHIYTANKVPNSASNILFGNTTTSTAHQEVAVNTTELGTEPQYKNGVKYLTLTRNAAGGFDVTRAEGLNVVGVDNTGKSPKKNMAEAGAQATTYQVNENPQVREKKMKKVKEAEEEKLGASTKKKKYRDANYDQDSEFWDVMRAKAECEKMKLENELTKQRINQETALYLLKRRQIEAKTEYYTKLNKEHDAVPVYKKKRKTKGMFINPETESVVEATKQVFSYL